MNLPAMRIVVAEDERDQRDQLVRLIRSLWPQAQIVAECADGTDALAALNRHQPEALFLDIRMPGTSGMDVARAASGRAHVVLMTAYEEYAVRAFEAGAVDYLLKPVVPERLAAAIDRLVQRATGDPPDIDRLLAALEARLRSTPCDRLQWITATCGDTVKLVAIDEVRYFQASDKYVRVVTADDEAIVRTSLKELQERLDPDVFWRIHRSTIVAAAEVRQIEKNELGHWHARLRNGGEQLPVSASARALFRGM